MRDERTPINVGRRPWDSPRIDPRLQSRGEIGCGHWHLSRVSRITSVQDRDTQHPDSDRPAVAIHGRSICGPTTFATRHRPMRSSHIVTWAERTQTHTNGPGHWNNSGLNSVPATVKVDWH